MYQRIQEYFQTLGIEKVVIYGYKAQRHTHYWVQAAFYRAFERLKKEGLSFELAWEDNLSLLRERDVENALVIGNVNVHHVDFALPISDKAFYIIHNHAPKRFDAARYRPLQEAGRCITFEVFRGKTYDDSYEEISGEPCHAVSVSKRNAVLTWATDLLPDEIELNIERVREREALNGAERPVVFVGSIWRVNKDAMMETVQYCVDNGLKFTQYGGYVAEDFRPAPHPDIAFHKEFVDAEANASLVRDAYIAPAVQGASQLANPHSVGNYVPCRVFKNLSYGNWAVTNNSTANAMFDNRLVFAEEIPALMRAAADKLNEPDAKEALLSLMAEVRDKHTYINRIETLLFAFDACRRATLEGSSAVNRPLHFGLQNRLRRSAYAVVKLFSRRAEQ